MKRRITLSDNELAYGSWLYVTLYLVRNKWFAYLHDVKEHYITEHTGDEFYWKHSCKLCDDNYNEDDCKKCVLYKTQKEQGVKVDWRCGCGSRSWYDTIMESNDQEECINAALKICQVMARECEK